MRTLLAAAVFLVSTASAKADVVYDLLFNGVSYGNAQVAVANNIATLSITQHFSDAHRYDNVMFCEGGTCVREGDFGIPTSISDIALSLNRSINLSSLTFSTDPKFPSMAVGPFPSGYSVDLYGADFGGPITLGIEGLPDGITAENLLTDEFGPALAVVVMSRFQHYPFPAQDTLYSGTAVSAVPEPSTWAMLMIGFAGLGFVAHRRSFRSRARLRQRSPSLT